MNLVKLATSTFALTLLIIPINSVAYAEEVCPQGYENLCKIDVGIVPNIISFLIILAIILSVIFLIVGGIKWITSSGDKQKLDQARSTIIGAIVGLVISLLAYFFISIIVHVFTGNDGLNLPIPKLV